MILHPRERTLQEFASATEHTDTRVQRHLQTCQRCRDIVATYRTIYKVAREERVIAAPGHVLDRTLELRAEGARAILPSSDPAPRTRAPITGIAAAIIAIVVIAVLFDPPAAGARLSELVLTPAHPGAGATVDVLYRPIASLAKEQRLSLRARLRTQHDEAYNRRSHQITIAQLDRQRDGTFRGRFTLPREAVYAAFAIESEDGDDVDSNHRRLWDLLVHDAAGRPLTAALEQQSNDMMGRDWVRAFAAADSLTTLAPDRPAVWSALLFYQKQVLRGPALDSAMPRHRARLAKFDTNYSAQRTLDGKDLGALMWYARGLQDTVLMAKWRDRLLRDAPLNTSALQELIIDELNKNYNKPELLLPYFDRVWKDTRGAVETGPGFGHLYVQAFNAALRSGDSAAITKWAARSLAWEPGDSLQVAMRLTENAQSRAKGITMLRHLLAKSAVDDRLRDLYRTRAEQRLLDRKLRQQPVATLASALLAAGDTTAAVTAYKEAAELYWNADVFRQFGALELARGDTTTAGQLFARVAIDPATPRAYADTAQRLLGKNSSQWQAWTNNASAVMQRSAMEMATRVLLPNDVTIEDLKGRSTTLAAVMAGKPALVVYWSRNCGYAMQAAPAIQALADKLRAQGNAVIVVADEKPSAELEAVMIRAGLHDGLYADASNQVSKYFNAFGTPAYFVLDDGGNIRFEYTELQDVPRQIAALSRTGGQ